MKLCFPVQSNEGIESRVYNHFGSAPMFVVVDTDTHDVESIANRDRHHEHGACNPIRALGNHTVDAVIVGGIGGGALSRLNQRGVRVFQAGAATVGENITMFLTRRLPEYTLQQCCGGHKGSGGCAHKKS